MVTSHLLAVPNTESTNCYNLWLACLGHLQPLARHSLSPLISDYVSAFGIKPRLRFLGFATSLLQLWFFPAPARLIASGGLPRIRSYRFRIPWSYPNDNGGQFTSQYRS